VWAGGQKALSATHAAVAQTGSAVTISGAGAKPGGAPDVVLSVKGSPDRPWIFWLDGKACTS
jgi:endoglucanase